MVTIHNLGFPRIGKKRELKFALERYWEKEITEKALQQTAKELRAENWQAQSALDLIPVGDFSLYDQVLDMSFLLGNIPERVRGLGSIDLNNYFRVARGRSAADESTCGCVSAAEMTKWFDTNYHYIVPEFDIASEFSLNADVLLRQITEAQVKGHDVKPVIIGPLTYLWLGKARDGSDKLKLLDRVVDVYLELFSVLEDAGVTWLQIDEPVLVTELESGWQQAFRSAYDRLQHSSIRLLLATYFGELKENLSLVVELPVDGLHLDAINARDEIEDVVSCLPKDRVLSLGVIDGRNIWKTDISATLGWLEPIYRRLQRRLWLAPSCSLLHVPVDLDSEPGLDREVSSWFAFAVQKLDELVVIAAALDGRAESVIDKIEENNLAIKHRQRSALVHVEAVKQRVSQIDKTMGMRKSSYQSRIEIQREKFKLPLYPTTTIGSFPQTREIRKTRNDYRNDRITEQRYIDVMKNEIADCVRKQESLGLDVLVHGEPERNDMVEYFGEQLTGYAFTQFGWVQSYGSRCVKPPIIYGDIARPKAMTVDWTSYAQSLTSKPMKGMLTGPVTILNWSFVRDDQPRAETCKQLALAIRDEVLDLEASGVDIIQIDEAALREGLPLRKTQWRDYLDWAVAAFRISANGVKDETQIHTHMCYSEFNDIIEAIADMDADVITIETARSDMELLDVFDEFRYPNQIGPGVYDIHSPNVPSIESIIELMEKATQRIPARRLWVNPDCGLKTRRWDEVVPALENMVAASKRLSQARV